ncbi:uncharacterized protein LOC134246971 [Saccostrea cucullata]|uniref:uncharacterized protein LOC134246971 n=1 Tax=Saccostrea cuccullata TaxID=36930 RepID=UPI002ED537A6
MHKMITCFESTLRKIETKSNLSFGEYLSERTDVILYIPSNTSEENETLLPPKLETNILPEDKVSIWPDSVLVYFQEDGENLEQIKKKIRGFQKTSWSSEIIVLSPGTRYGSQSFGQNTFTIVDCNKKSIREAISKCLEASVSQYLKDKMSNLIKVEESDKCLLKAKLLSLQTLLSKSTPCKPSKRIPKKIKDYLFEHPSVLSFAIWEGKKFRIIVKDITCKEGLEQDLNALDPDGDFLLSHMIEILKGSVRVSRYVKQGDKLVPGHSVNGSQTEENYDAASTSERYELEECCYGTLGAFMEDKSNGELYGITCRHVIPHKHEKVYIRIDQNKPLSEFGHSVYTSEKPFEDLAVFKVNDHVTDECIKTFQNDDEYECNATVYPGHISDNLIVHKKGAATGWTIGRIQSRECYSRLIPDQNEVFLVNGFDEEFFSLGGDSGSAVFKRDESFDQSTVSVLGMVLGGMESNYEDHRPEIEKSTMCFTLNNSLNAMTKCNGLELEFPSIERSLCNDSD